MTLSTMFDIRMGNINQLLCGIKHPNGYAKIRSGRLTIASLPPSPLVPGGQQREIIVSKSDTKVLITDFSRSKDYIVSVTAVSGTAQSRPLQGRYKGMHFSPIFPSISPFYFFNYLYSIYYFYRVLPYLGFVLISTSKGKEFRA